MEESQKAIEKANCEKGIFQGLRTEQEHGQTTDAAPDIHQAAKLERMDKCLGLLVIMEQL